VLRESEAGAARPLPTPDLRTGTWTRLGEGAVVGDHLTELALGRIAERARAAAEAQGYAVGWSTGSRDAAERAVLDRAAHERAALETETRRAAEHAAAMAALRAAVEELHAESSALRARLEAQATELALAVTEAVLGAGAAASVPADVVARVLEVLPVGPAVRLRVHPTVARTASADLPESVDVVADPSLGTADALVELADHVVDLRVDEAYRRVREALTDPGAVA
jgi:flagellar assembly protein FliH